MKKISKLEQFGELRIEVEANCFEIQYTDLYYKNYTFVTKIINLRQIVVRYLFNIVKLTTNKNLNVKKILSNWERKCESYDMVCFLLVVGVDLLNESTQKNAITTGYI